MKIKLKIRFFAIVLLVIVAINFLTACRSQNFDKGIVEYDKRQYATVSKFQINQVYFDNNGALKKDYSDRLTNINGSAVYSIKGLDVKDWIYFDFANCDVSFYLSKNIATTLNDKYYDFSEKFQLVRDEYTVKDGLKRVVDKTIENKSIVAYAFKVASSKGDSDMGVTSDKLTAYSLLLTPKDYPALQYNIGYYECENGYFIGSNTNNLNTKVDNLIHEIINKLY